MGLKSHLYTMLFAFQTKYIYLGCVCQFTKLLVWVVVITRKTAAA